MNLVAKDMLPRKTLTIRVCLSFHASLGQPKNSKQRSWSILMILIASPQVSGRPFQCHWPSGANGTIFCFGVLSHDDIKHWAESFLTALEREPEVPSQLEQMPAVGLQ